MTEVITLPTIQKVLSKIPASELLRSIETGLVAQSQGRVTAPPVGHLAFSRPPGDVHIKYGYIQGDDYYVIKIASSFYNNPTQGLPSSNGSMHVYDQKTGECVAILLDEGYLTDVRTAIVGAVVAKRFAPAHVQAIGIVGTGTQARFQLSWLKEVLDCRKVYVWGRSEESMHKYRQDMAPLGFDIIPTSSVAELAASSNYIVTTTPSTQPLLHSSQLRAQTHLTAVGADAAGKQELDPTILSIADIVVVDSLRQCIGYGEASHAVRSGLIKAEELRELGDALVHDIRRANDHQITVADITGVAVQDITIAILVHRTLQTMKPA